MEPQLTLFSAGLSALPYHTHVFISAASLSATHLHVVDAVHQGLEVLRVTEHAVGDVLHDGVPPGSTALLFHYYYLMQQHGEYNSMVECAITTEW